MINDSTEEGRYAANYKLISTLVDALKEHNSYSFKFDSVKTITISNSSDQRFRIFSWHVENNDGSFRYYGAIQINAGPSTLQLIPLNDQTANIKAPMDSLLINKNWYGCQYYKIIPVTSTPRPYYILLGWKGYNHSKTQKIIEVLTLDNKSAQFGKVIFDGHKDWKYKFRVVFEYSKQVSMLLNYDNNSKTIVFDHLAPPHPAQENDFSYYGPDLTYDGLKLERGRLKFVQNLDLKNDPSTGDVLYIDPKSPQKEHINKIEK